MKSVRPKLAANVADLKLSPEEGFVMARVDGQLSVNDLAALTGLAAPKVETIVRKLASEGAVTLEAGESSGYLPDVGSEPSLGGGEETTSLADFAAVLGLDPTAFAAQNAAPAKERPVAQPRVESKSDYPPPAVTTDEGSQPELPAELGRVDELEELETAPAEGEAEGATEGDEQAAEEPQAAVNEEVEANERNFRQLYEHKFHALPTDARVHAAQTSQGSDLFALCFDSEPRVVSAILDNPASGLDHARLIAFHHRTSTGLEMLSRRTEFLRDMLVERRLLRNPMCGEMVLSRIMSSKRLHQTYKIAIDRDIPEITRAKSRGHLRQKWQTAPSEERADLVFRTEGRCLQYMTGCTFDAKTTGIMCGKQYNSVLFIQNLAKFAATPPGLLAHLMKQPFVRKNAPLKKLLLQHPNMPGEVKRQM